MAKVLRYGMVGGGEGAFFGSAHRRAIGMEGKAKLVAGCFSCTYDNTLRTGDSLDLDRDRLYQSFDEMAKAEAARPDCIDFVVIVTPNSTHYAACKAFLEAGIPVSCDKPLTVDVEQAVELETLAKSKGLQFMVTYGYSGHVTALHAKELVRTGAIGEVRAVMAEYVQGWLAFEDICGNKQGEWRINPDISGKTNALGDIGTHIENTVYRMTGLKLRRVLARMDVVVPTRKLDDNSYVMVEYDNGATGVYWASQIAIGHDNGLRVRIYGSQGSIFWSQEQPEVIKIAKEDGTLCEVHRGQRAILPAAAKYQRLPSGHPEGLLEALSNYYSNFIDCLIAEKKGCFSESMIEYPTVVDGVNGVLFVEACLRSSNGGNVWVDVH